MKQYAVGLYFYDFPTSYNLSQTFSYFTQ